MNSFKILKKDSKTSARLGVLKTPHGTVKTPTYVFVATYGNIRHLSSIDIKKTKTQLFISNTFHLWERAVKSKSTIRNSLIRNLGNLPLMTDSGGFQVLSLAFNDKNKIGKFIGDEGKIDDDYKRNKIKITEKGVYFKWDNKWRFLGPELSMKIQKKIGADIIFAFDHITSPLDDYQYNKKAIEVTDRWALRCLDEHRKQTPLRQGYGKAQQMLFGIVQGGLFKDLRIKSAKSIGSMPFDGFGIGGSYTKKQIAQVLKWITPHLPEEKPRHLLGVGKIDDIFEAVESGIDTFDCVIPTREARHGRLYTKKGHLDIRRGYFLKDKKPIEPGCKCPTCLPVNRHGLAKIPRSKIRELIKSIDKELNAKGQRYCLMHNMWFFNQLLKDIRLAIEKNRLEQFKKNFIKNFNKK